MNKQSNFSKFSNLLVIQPASYFKKLDSCKQYLLRKNHPMRGPRAIAERVLFSLRCPLGYQQWIRGHFCNILLQSSPSQTSFMAGGMQKLALRFACDGTLKR